MNERGSNVWRRIRIRCGCSVIGVNTSLSCNRYAERLIYLSNYSLPNVTAFPVSLMKTQLNFLWSLAIGVFVTPLSTEI
jgi:hypothetical protein